MKSLNVEASILTLKELLQKQKMFVIPNYQRGYIWGKSHVNGGKNSVEYILESIMCSYETKRDLFLQGITVTEDAGSVTLIDGQQRMTFFYLLLNYLWREKGLKTDVDFSIRYSIRTESQGFLDKIKKAEKGTLLKLCSEDKDEKFQDLFYFKKTIRDIDCSSIEKTEGFLDFLLDKIKFLYVPVQKENATNVFSMMNGNKALMKDCEKVKAEILRLVSQEEENVTQSVVWEQDILRSRYAREWDRWLYWWNREEVKVFFCTTDIMGWLLSAYLKSKSASSKKAEYTFQNFQETCLRGSVPKNKAEEVFYELRQLQKTFEDVYNSVADDKKLHNKVGAILHVLKKEDRERFVISYFAKREFSVDEIEQYYKYVFLSLSHNDIAKAIKQADDRRNQDEDEVREKIEEMLKALKNDYLYMDKDDCNFACLQLLRMNIDADSLLGRPFDFSIWKERSLEHIWPKSKVYHTDDKGRLFNGNDDSLNKGDVTSDMLNRAQFKGNGSEHCIGNLVLLYKSDNSSFNAKSFDEKKKTYFDMDGLSTFKSRTLLHTMSVFASATWGVKEIRENKQKMIKSVEEYYG